MSPTGYSEEQPQKKKREKEQPKRTYRYYDLSHRLTVSNILCTKQHRAKKQQKLRCTKATAHMFLDDHMQPPLHHA